MGGDSGRNVDFLPATLVVNKFAAAMADGSVHVFDRAKIEDILPWMILRNDPARHQDSIQRLTPAATVNSLAKDAKPRERLATLFFQPPILLEEVDAFGTASAAADRVRFGGLFAVTVE
jgi:hypothetical protein